MASPIVAERLTNLRTLLSSSPTTPTFRPLLTHLSADNSWLLSIPIPKRTQGKAYFHLLHDAWLTSTNTAFPGASWFQQQTHIETPAYQSISDVNDLIADIEIIASGGTDEYGVLNAGIDVVVVGHPYSDHADYATLRQVDASVPVLAVDAAVPVVQSWEHFDTVLKIPDFGNDSTDFDWRTASATQAPWIPSWLAVWRLLGTKELGGLHYGICVVFDLEGAGNGKAECVIHTPHGLFAENVAVIKRADPVVKTLALLHTTKQSFFYGWGKANLGAENGLQVARELGAKYCKLPLTMSLLMSKLYGSKCYIGQLEALDLSGMGEFL